MIKSEDAEYLRNLAKAFDEGNQPAHAQKLRYIAEIVQQHDDEFNEKLGEVISHIHSSLGDEDGG